MLINNQYFFKNYRTLFGDFGLTKSPTFGFFSFFFLVFRVGVFGGRPRSPASFSGPKKEAKKNRRLCRILFF